MDLGALLSTLAQSSAAIVAIVGGFLVSRLVQLSSEREGLRRQYVRTYDELEHIRAEYDAAHSYRLENSKSEFYCWVIEYLVDADTKKFDYEALLEQNIPHGSSAEEMRSYLSELIERVDAAKHNMNQYIQAGDDDSLTLDDLKERGLEFQDSDLGIYESLEYQLYQSLPSRPTSLVTLSHRLPPLDSPVTRSAELRRLDESIRDEQNLQSKKVVLEAEQTRLTNELERIGSPTGVKSAILILSLYSILGILAPVMVMALGLQSLATWVVWLLVVFFTIGLCSVLIYIYWYARTLGKVVTSDVSKGGN